MGPPRPGCRTDTALVPGRRVCLYDYEYVLLWEKLEPVQLRLVGDLLWDGARPYLEDGSQEEARPTEKKNAVRQSRTVRHSAHILPAAYVRLRLWLRSVANPGSAGLVFFIEGKSCTNNTYFIDINK